MEFGTLEREHALARLEATPASMMPRDITALVAFGGNSTFERSRRAKRQLRDRLKRFAYEGKGGRFLARLGKNTKDKLGMIVGGSNAEGYVEMYMPEDDAELGIKKGDILKINTDNFDAADVLLTEEQLAKAGIKLNESKVSSAKRAQDIGELLANKLEAPSDWKKQNNGDWKTADGFTATPLGDNKFQLKDAQGNPVAGLESAEWPDIQLHIMDDAEKEFGNGLPNIDERPEGEQVSPASLKKGDKVTNPKNNQIREVKDVFTGDWGTSVTYDDGTKTTYDSTDVNATATKLPDETPLSEATTPGEKKAAADYAAAKKKNQDHAEWVKTSQAAQVKESTESYPEPKQIGEENGHQVYEGHDGGRWVWSDKLPNNGMGWQHEDKDGNVGAIITDNVAMGYTGTSGYSVNMLDEKGNFDGKAQYDVAGYEPGHVIKSINEAVAGANAALGGNRADSAKKQDVKAELPVETPVAEKKVPKNKPSKKQKEMIRSMLLERTMTSEQRQAYMDRLASIDKFEVSALFNELKALPKAKVPLKDSTDPLNQHEDKKLAAIKQAIAPFDLDGSIRRFIDERTANGGEVTENEIRAKLNELPDWKEGTPGKYGEYSNEFDIANSKLSVYKNESQNKQAEANAAAAKAAKAELKAKLDGLKQNQASLPTLSPEEHQAKLDELVATISDEDDPNHAVRDGILSGKLRTGDDIIAALRKQEKKNEYKTMSPAKFATGYDYISTDESKRPDEWAIINAAYGLPAAPEGFDDKFMSNELKSYDNENGDLAALIESGASGTEIIKWLDANSTSWKSQKSDYDTRMYVDFPFPSQKANWKAFGEFLGRINSHNSDKQPANNDFVDGVNEKLPQDTVKNLDAELGNVFNGDSLTELLSKVSNEEDLQRVSDEISAARATQDLTPQQDAQLQQVQDATIKKFYEDNPDLENTMAEPANIVVPAEPLPDGKPEAATELETAVELEKPSKPLGTKVYTFDYGFGPNEITVDGDTMYGAARLVKAAYDLPEAKGLKKTDIDFLRGQIGQAMANLEQKGDFKRAAENVKGAIANVRQYAGKLKDEDAKAKIFEALDNAQKVYDKAYSEEKLSDTPTPFDEKGPNGEVLAKPVKEIAPAESAPVEQTADAVSNPFSTANSDKLLVEAKTNRKEIEDVDSAISFAIEHAGVNYTPMLQGITGNEHVVKNILDDLDASDGANNIALSSSLYELHQALVDAGIAPLVTEHIKDIADAMDAFIPADTGDKNNVVTVDAIKQEQAGNLDLSTWKKVGGQKGSNPGGTYENPETGEQVYVKTPKSQLHGENERLASALYDAAGIPAAKVFAGKDANGNDVTYSPMIDGATPDLKKKLKDKEYMARLQQGFAMDALLGNWDVVGLDFDNVVTDKNGEPVRVDPGGALLFRAQGAPKGNAFGEDVPELDSFTDKTSSRPAAKVFSQMSDEQKLASAEILKNLAPSQIDELVDAIITDPTKREELKTKLKARREFILNKFGLGDNGNGGGNGGQEPNKSPEASQGLQPVSMQDVLKGKMQGSPADNTVLNLGDEGIRTQAAKAVQSQLPDGYTATPEKGLNNSGFVMVKNAQGETVAMMTNDPDDPSKIAVQNFKAGWKIETVSSVSEGMSKLVDAIKVVEEPGQVAQLSDGSTGKIGMHVEHVVTGEDGTIVKFDKNPAYVVVLGADGKKKTKSVNKLKAANGGGTPVVAPEAPSAPSAPSAPETPKASGPASVDSAKKFTFDFQGLSMVEDAPEVTMPTDPLDADIDNVKTDAAGTLIKPGAILKDANGRVGVYRSPGYGDPKKMRMIWEDGTQDSVMPDTVTATGKYLTPGIAGVYAGLADLDFQKNSTVMPDNYTGSLKDKNGKSIGSYQLVVDSNGELGVVVESGFDGYLKVAFPDGTKKRKSTSVEALDLRYTKSDYNIKIAQKHYAVLDKDKYGLPVFGKKISSNGTSKTPSGKITVPKTGAGAKPEGVKDLGWNESDFQGAPSLEELLTRVSDTSKPGSGLAGGSVALDADSVEDLDLRIMAADGTDGKDAYLLKYKLTSWAGDALANELVGLVNSGDPRVSVVSGLNVPENMVAGDKVSFVPSLGGKAYKSGYGQTFIITLEDGTKIHFLRADVPTQHSGGAAKFAKDAPRAYHNKVMIIAPKETATPDNLALTLKTAGVQDVRPSTQADAKILIENRLMSIFDEKVDPKSNLSGAQRQESLTRIKDKWGIGPENVTITTGAGGRIEMRLDEESAKKIAKKTYIKALRHQLRTTGIAQNPGESDSDHRDRVADYFVSRVATPQGGLLSTTTRWSEGVPTSGMSSQTDINTGGADYVFTTPLHGVNSNTHGLVPQIFFDPNRVFQRLDFWANSTDKFGKRFGKDPISAAKPGGYEVMFKGRLSFDDAEVLMVQDEDMRTRIITKLRQKGITQIGGRPLEAVIMTGPDYHAAKKTVQ
jgi:hypothetical protein